MANGKDGQKQLRKAVRPVGEKVKDKTRDFFTSLQRGGDFKAVELIVTFIILGWGVSLLFIEDLFETSKSYQAMQAIADEWLWALAAIGISSVGFAGMVLSSYRMRKISMALASGWFFGISAMLALNINTGAPTYFILALASSWAYKKVGEQRDDERRKQLPS